MNSLSIALKITNFGFDHNYISDQLGLAPSAMYFKGQNYFTGPPKNRIQKQYQANYWEYRIQIDNNTAWIKSVIDQFVEEVIAQRYDAIQEIKSTCSLELYVGVKFFSGHNLDSFHFDIHVLKLLADLNIEIDIDQYLFK